MPEIAVITGTRAEYGLLKPLIRRLQRHDSFNLQLYVTGTHLSSDHGHTVDEIIADGLDDFTTVDIAPGKTVSDTASSMALCLERMVAAFSWRHPDLIIVLGDRYEIFATVQAAMLLNIPVAHIHGGEITKGAIDDAMRHGITKMAHLHFTAAEAYRQRVIQMGEHPERVFNTGSLGYENILTAPLLSQDEIEQDLDFKFRNHNLLVTHHPVTSSQEYLLEIDHILQVLDRLGSDTGIIMTAANADPGGLEIIHKKQEFAKKHGNCLYIPNLGMAHYYSVMRLVDGLVGNSSSGVIEAPFLGKWTLNIGPRQHGRLKAETVVDCDATDDLAVLLRQLIDRTHPAATHGVSSLFGDGNASLKIIAELEKLDPFELGMKSFFDMSVSDLTICG